MPNFIHRVEYYLPENTIDCIQLDKEKPDWNIAETLPKTGVRFLHHANAEETTLDIAFKAASKALEGIEELPDTLIVCTQTPDTLLPHCSAMLQDKLGLDRSTKCFDLSLGCSGYGYGLATGYSYLRSGLSKRVLLVTVDNYSKIINPENKKAFLLFSDGASATILDTPDNDPVFHFGTDGSRNKAVICENSGVSVVTGEAANQPIKKPSFEMDGYGVFLFTLGTIPSEISKLMEKSDLNMDDIDLFIFHQASRYVLESIAKKLNIPEEKFILDLEEVGNTTSSSIPIALKRAEESGRLKRGNKVLTFGFGIGLSWSGAVFNY
ncbi:3-oxoacyl-ACP synthase III family protein [Maridesulfovibrio frigidus]|uniref:3-oxoacyl-ACP synthase III family protein n=1 Tax=Maridesulfovibrio frigidus TaxID=340956 RepID=UPI0004E1A05B|nr:ketoacyl-ACP synthase III [Maridesulfovibrio frigidus]